MRQIGLETYTHNFTLNYPLGGGKVFKGKNVYGILRAPRIGSTESIVISVPYRPPESMHAEITHGVPLMLAFAEFARSMFFSFNFIFLIKNVFFRKCLLGQGYYFLDNRTRTAGNASLAGSLSWI